MNLRTHVWTMYIYMVMVSQVSRFLLQISSQVKPLKLNLLRTYLDWLTYWFIKAEPKSKRQMDFLNSVPRGINRRSRCLWFKALFYFHPATEQLTFIAFCIEARTSWFSFRRIKHFPWDREGSRAGLEIIREKII